MITENRSVFLKITFLCLGILACITVYGQDENLPKVKKVKRFIRPCIYLNSYSTPSKPINNTVLGSYQFKQGNLGFYFPLATKTWFSPDSVKMNSFHLLFTGNIQTATLNFDSTLYDRKIYKMNLGMHLIYTFGKNVLFFGASPFVSQDDRTLNDPVYRFASVVLFSRTVSRGFSYRLGITRTNLFGRTLHLPIVGFRIGPLDGLNLNIQLPRNISFNFPMGKSRRVSGTVFARPMGGIYNISNPDSLYPNLGSQIVFGRKELISGFQLNVRTGNHFSFFVSTGFTHNRRIYFYDNADHQNSVAIDNGMFFNFGLTLRIGKAKQVYNNYTMYDAFNINNTYDHGNNNGPQHSDIPVNPERYNAEKININKIKYRDIEDLMYDE